MKNKIALIFISFIMLQACGSRGMMFAETSMDNINVALVVVNS